MSSKNQRLNATITIGSVLEGSVKRNVGFLKNGLHQVGDAIKGVERRQKELARERKTLERQGKSVDHLDREYRELERTLERLKRAQERWNKAAAASRRVGATFGAMASDIGRQSRRIAIGAGLAGGAVFGLASSTASLGDDVAKTADKLGFSIEGLQELRYAAERSGVATATFDSSMVAMTKRIGEASQGFGAAKKALDHLGLSAKDMVKLSPEEQLAAIAEKMQHIKDPAEKAAIASGLFSRAGIGMVTMLKDGSDGLNQLTEDARRTGYVLSEQAARDAEVFQDTLLDTQLALAGLKNTVGAALMPVVTGAMKRIGDALVENREGVKKWAENFANGVEKTLPLIAEVAQGIGRVGEVVWKVIEATADMAGGWQNFGMVIGAALAAGTVAKVLKFGAAVFSLGKSLIALAATTPLVAGGIKAIGAVLMANPIGVAVAAIAGAAALIYAKWDKIGPWFKKTWARVKSIFSGFTSFISGPFQSAMNSARQSIQSAWDGVTAFFGSVWSSIEGVFDAAWSGAIQPVISGLSSVGGISAAWEGVKAGLGAVLDWIAEKFQWVGTIIAPVIDKIRWVKDKGAGAVAAVSGLFGGGGSSDEAKPPAIQKNALGGPFGPGWHLTGELGPELKFENRSGYVANNRALRQLADYADRASGALKSKAQQNPTVDRVGAFLKGLGSNLGAEPKPSMPALKPFASESNPAPSTGQSVAQTINYTINAAGASAEDIIRIVERKSRQAASNGLYDRVSPIGPMGR